MRNGEKRCAPPSQISLRESTQRKEPLEAHTGENEIESKSLESVDAATVFWWPCLQSVSYKTARLVVDIS
jgi:hypothetical protein